MTKAVSRIRPANDMIWRLVSTIEVLAKGHVVLHTSAEMFDLGYSVVSVGDGFQGSLPLLPQQTSGRYERKECCMLETIACPRPLPFIRLAILLLAYSVYHEGPATG